MVVSIKNTLQTLRELTNATDNYLDDYGTSYSNACIEITQEKN